METSAKEIPPRLSFFKRVLDNPVIAKELKGRMRGRQGFILLTAYLMLIGFFVTVIYLALYESGGSANMQGYSQTVGKALFGAVVLLELLLISFIGPALTSGAISSERERQTFDLLHISLLSAPSLVFGKLGSAVIYLLLLIFSAIPVQSFAFFLGGVGVAEMTISTLMLVVTAVFVCSLGLFFSSFTKRTISSTVLTYGSSILSFVIFFALLLIFSIFGPILSPSSPAAPSVAIQNMTTLAFWSLFSVNPFFAAIVSETILIDSQSAFTTTTGLFGNSSFPLPSPWIIYVVYRVLFSMLLILLSIFFVNRVER
ncbi:MAG: hypothetical protein PHQ36_12005 [Anaerolineales bacterium]|nr:hypothetical protein [Anaerolineales bacterium]